MPRSVLLIANDSESRHFLVPDVRGRLRRMVPGVMESPPPPDRDAWADLLRDTKPEVLIGAWSLPALDDSLLLANPQLCYICLLTGAFRHRVPESFLAGGRIVTNWGDAAAPMVAECALAMTLACLREFNRISLGANGKNVWPDRLAITPRSLFGRRVGLHGFGAVARHLVRLMAPFSVRLQCWSEPVPDAYLVQHGVEPAQSLEALMHSNDVVIEAEALTPQTRGSVNAACIAAMRPGTVFVNVGRGATVDEQALAARARQGDILIGLDVYQSEPLPEDSPLRGLPNALLLPHIAGPTPDHFDKIAMRALDNLEAFLGGQTPPDSRSLLDYQLST